MIKGLLKYAGLLLLIAFAVLVVSLGVMFVSVKVNPQDPIKIMGYSFFEFYEGDEHSILNSNSEFDTIEINVKNINVEVSCINSSGAMHLTYKNRMWGVAKVDKNATYGKSYEVVDNVLKITVAEPEESFLINTNSSLLKLELSKSYSAKNIIINGFNSNINIGGSNQLLKVNDLTLNVNNAKVDVATLKNNLANVTINSNNNKVTINNNITGELKAKTNISTFNMKDISTVNVEATNLQLNAGKVSETTFKSKSGIIDFSESGNINVDGNIQTKIGSLTGTYTDVNRKSTNLFIDNATGAVQASSNSGEVKINNASGGVNIKTTIGNITLKNVSCSVTIKTTSGICKVDFADEVVAGCELNFTAKNGSLTSNNISIKTSVEVEDDGVCILNLNFSNLVGENIINGKKGKINIVAPIKACVLNVSSTGTKDISYADIISKENIENAYISGAVEGTETKLTISATSGKVTLKSAS